VALFAALAGFSISVVRSFRAPAPKSN